MILTVTLNPSVDISYRLENFVLGTSNRCSNTIKTAGGKGLNVARVLKQLGADVITTGFLGGNLGDFIKKSLDKEEIKNEFLMTDRQTRNCIAILSQGIQTEILESGQPLEKEHLTQFLSKYEQLCKKADVVDISGSAPKGIETSYIEDLIKIAKDNNCIVIVDSSGKILEEIVTGFEYKPDFIKPNMQEFTDLICKIKGDDSYESVDVKTDLLKYMSDIKTVILSCSSKGAYVKNGDSVYKVDIPKINVVNPVGSGDSSVAGLAYALDNDMNFEDMIKLSNACGISNCMTDKTGYIQLDIVEDMKEKIKIRRLD